MTAFSIPIVLTLTAQAEVSRVDLYLCPGNRIRFTETPSPQYTSTKDHKPTAWGEGWVADTISLQKCGVSHPVPKAVMYYENDGRIHWTGSGTALGAVDRAFKPLLQSPLWHPPTSPNGDMDCLAGFCLGEPLLTPPPSTVWVSDQLWDLHVETCAGQIVTIRLDSGEWSSKGLLPLHETLIEMGWVEHYTDRPPSLSLGYNPGGERKMSLEGRRGIRTLTDFRGTRVRLTTTHPDKHNLCRPERQQGL